MMAPVDPSYQRLSSAPSCSGRTAVQGLPIHGTYVREGASSRRYRRRISKAFLVDQHIVGTRLRNCLGSAALQLPLLAGLVSSLEMANLVVPQPSLAGESLSIEFLSSFLDNVEHLGPYGPLFLVAVMICAEMVPLFPTQPLSIASGLLFGGPKGALLAVIGTSSAAMLAFQLSRKLGEKIAEQAAAEEMSEEQRQSGLFTRVQNAIESGSIQQQVVAVTLLRLTPVIPFSATNYLLGATPLQFPAYVAGSLVGLTFWCSVYATLGAAGRQLLRGGLGLDVLFDELMSKAGSYTEDAAIIMGIVGLLIFAYTKLSPQSAGVEDQHDEHKHRRT